MDYGHCDDQLHSGIDHIPDKPLSPRASATTFTTFPVLSSNKLQVTPQSIHIHPKSAHYITTALDTQQYSPIPTHRAANSTLVIHTLQSLFGFNPIAKNAAKELATQAVKSFPPTSSLQQQLAVQSLFSHQNAHPTSSSRPAELFNTNNINNCANGANLSRPILPTNNASSSSPHQTTSNALNPPVSTPSRLRFFERLFRSSSPPRNNQNQTNQQPSTNSSIHSLPPQINSQTSNNVQHTTTASTTPSRLFQRLCPFVRSTTSSQSQNPLNSRSIPPNQRFTSGRHFAMGENGDDDEDSATTTFITPPIGSNDPNATDWFQDYAESMFTTNQQLYEHYLQERDLVERQLSDYISSQQSYLTQNDLLRLNQQLTLQQYRSYFATSSVYIQSSIAASLLTPSHAICKSISSSLPNAPSASSANRLLNASTSSINTTNSASTSTSLNTTSILSQFAPTILAHPSISSNYLPTNIDRRDFMIAALQQRHNPNLLLLEPYFVRLFSGRPSVIQRSDGVAPTTPRKIPPEMVRSYSSYQERVIDMKIRRHQIVSILFPWVSVLIGFADEVKQDNRLNYHGSNDNQCYIDNFDTNDLPQLQHFPVKGRSKAKQAAIDRNILRNQHQCTHHCNNNDDVHMDFNDYMNDGSDNSEDFYGDNEHNLEYSDEKYDESDAFSHSSELSDSDCCCCCFCSEDSDTSDNEADEWSGSDSNHGNSLFQNNTNNCSHNNNSNSTKLESLISVHSRATSTRSQLSNLDSETNAWRYLFTPSNHPSISSTSRDHTSHNSHQLAQNTEINAKSNISSKNNNSHHNSTSSSKKTCKHQQPHHPTPSHHHHHHQNSTSGESTPSSSPRLPLNFGRLFTQPVLSTTSNNNNVIANNNASTTPSTHIDNISNTFTPNGTNPTPATATGITLTRVSEENLRRSWVNVDIAPNSDGYNYDKDGDNFTDNNTNRFNYNNNFNTNDGDQGLTPSSTANKRQRICSRKCACSKCSSCPRHARKHIIASKARDYELKVGENGNELLHPSVVATHPQSSSSSSSSTQHPLVSTLFSPIQMQMHRAASSTVSSKHSSYGEDDCKTDPTINPLSPFHSYSRHNQNHNHTNHTNKHTLDKGNTKNPIGNHSSHSSTKQQQKQQKQQQKQPRVLPTIYSPNQPNQSNQSQSSSSSSTESPQLTTTTTRPNRGYTLNIDANYSNIIANNNTTTPSSTNSSTSTQSDTDSDSTNQPTHNSLNKRLRTTLRRLNSALPTSSSHSQHYHNSHHSHAVGSMSSTPKAIKSSSIAKDGKKAKNSTQHKKGSKTASFSQHLTITLDKDDFFSSPGQTSVSSTTSTNTHGTCHICNSNRSRPSNPTNNTHSCTHPLTSITHTCSHTTNHNNNNNNTSHKSSSTTATTTTTKLSREEREYNEIHCIDLPTQDQIDQVYHFENFLGCSHYERSNHIAASCCNRYYPCRYCHDQAENHQIVRKDINKIVCCYCLLDLYEAESALFASIQLLSEPSKSVFASCPQLIQLVEVLRDLGSHKAKSTQFTSSHGLFSPRSSTNASLDQNHTFSDLVIVPLPTSSAEAVESPHNALNRHDISFQHNSPSSQRHLTMADENHGFSASNTIQTNTSHEYSNLHSNPHSQSSFASQRSNTSTSVISHPSYTLAHSHSHTSTDGNNRNNNNNNNNNTSINNESSTAVTNPTMNIIVNPPTTTQITTSTPSTQSQASSHHSSLGSHNNNTNAIPNGTSSTLPITRSRRLSTIDSPSQPYRCIINGGNQNCASIVCEEDVILVVLNKIDELLSKCHSLHTQTHLPHNPHHTHPHLQPQQYSQGSMMENGHHSNFDQNAANSTSFGECTDKYDKNHEITDKANKMNKNAHISSPFNPSQQPHHLLAAASRNPIPGVIFNTDVHNLDFHHNSSVQSDFSTKYPITPPPTHQSSNNSSMLHHSMSLKHLAAHHQNQNQSQNGPNTGWIHQQHHQQQHQQGQFPYATKCHSEASMSIDNHSLGSQPSTITPSNNSHQSQHSAKTTHITCVRSQNPTKAIILTPNSTQQTLASNHGNTGVFGGLHADPMWNHTNTGNSTMQSNIYNNTAHNSKADNTMNSMNDDPTSYHPLVSSPHVHNSDNEGDIDAIEHHHPKLPVSTSSHRLHNPFTSTHPPQNASTTPKLMTALRKQQLIKQTSMTDHISTCALFHDFDRYCTANPCANAPSAVPAQPVQSTGQISANQTSIGPHSQNHSHNAAEIDINSHSHAHSPYYNSNQPFSCSNYTYTSTNIPSSSSTDTSLKSQQNQQQQQQLSSSSSSSILSHSKPNLTTINHYNFLFQQQQQQLALYYTRLSKLQDRIVISSTFIRQALQYLSYFVGATSNDSIYQQIKVYSQALPSDHAVQESSFAITHENTPNHFRKLPKKLAIVKETCCDDHDDCDDDHSKHIHETLFSKGNLTKNNNTDDDDDDMDEEPEIPTILPPVASNTLKTQWNGNTAGYDDNFLANISTFFITRAQYYLFFNILVINPLKQLISDINCYIEILLTPKVRPIPVLSANNNHGHPQSHLLHTPNDNKHLHHAYLNLDYPSTPQISPPPPQPQLQPQSLAHDSCGVELLQPAGPSTAVSTSLSIGSASNNIQHNNPHHTNINNNQDNNLPVPNFSTSHSLLNTTSALALSTPYAAETGHAIESQNSTNTPHGVKFSQKTSLAMPSLLSTTDTRHRREKLDEHALLNKGSGNSTGSIIPHHNSAVVMSFLQKEHRLLNELTQFLTYMQQQFEQYVVSVLSKSQLSQLQRAFENDSDTTAARSGTDMDDSVANTNTDEKGRSHDNKHHSHGKEDKKLDPRKLQEDITTMTPTMREMTLFDYHSLLKPCSSGSFGSNLNQNTAPALHPMTDQTKSDNIDSKDKAKTNDNKNAASNRSDQSLALQQLSPQHSSSIPTPSTVSNASTSTATTTFRRRNGDSEVILLSPTAVATTSPWKSQYNNLPASVVSLLPSHFLSDIFKEYYHHYHYNNNRSNTNQQAQFNPLFHGVTMNSNSNTISTDPHSFTPLPLQQSFITPTQYTLSQLDHLYLILYQPAPATTVTIHSNSSNNASNSSNPSQNATSMNPSTHYPQSNTTSQQHHSNSTQNTSLSPEQSKSLALVPYMSLPLSQHPNQSCSTCLRVLSRVFCDSCRLYDDKRLKAVTHCSICHICRQGTFNQLTHCQLCGVCYNKRTLRSWFAEGKSGNVYMRQACTSSRIGRVYSSLNMIWPNDYDLTLTNGMDPKEVEKIIEARDAMIIEKLEYWDYAWLPPSVLDKLFDLCPYTPPSSPSQFRDDSMDHTTLDRDDPSGRTRQQLHGLHCNSSKNDYTYDDDELVTLSTMVTTTSPNQHFLFTPRNNYNNNGQSGHTRATQHFTFSQGTQDTFQGTPGATIEKLSLPGDIPPLEAGSRSIKQFRTADYSAEFKKEMIVKYYPYLGGKKKDNTFYSTIQDYITTFKREYKQKQTDLIQEYNLVKKNAPALLLAYENFQKAHLQQQISAAKTASANNNALNNSNLNLDHKDTTEAASGASTSMNDGSIINTTLQNQSAVCNGYLQQQHAQSYASPIHSQPHFINKSLLDEEAYLLTKLPTQNRLTFPLAPLSANKETHPLYNPILRVRADKNTGLPFLLPTTLTQDIINQFVDIDDGLTFPHICIENIMKSSCFICLQPLSVGNVTISTLACSHVIHSSCLKLAVSSGLTKCFCRKSISHSIAYDKQVESYLANNPMPTIGNIFAKLCLSNCNDCSLYCITPFHNAFIKCVNCSSYNTTVKQLGPRSDY